MQNFRRSGQKQKRNDSPTADRKTLKKFSFVQKIFYLALVVQLCAAGSVRAQSFGGGIDGIENVTTTVFTDVTRTRVSAQIGSNTFTVASTAGISSPNDFVIVVQMVGGTIGVYVGGYVTASAGTSVTISPIGGAIAPS